MDASVTLRIKLEAATKKDDDRWIAHCLPIDVFSQGDTKEKALESLSEAVQLWFESCLDRDVLSEALAESGFTKVRADDPVPGGASVVEMIQFQPASHRKIVVPDYIEVEVPAYTAAHFSGLCATR
jgi:predicted RNase H-like HicB family nuclease